MSDRVDIRLEPLGRSVTVDRGASLQTVLAQHGVEFPCGGRGSCGACRVRVLRGDLAPTTEDIVALSRAQLAEGWRLTCRRQVHADLVLEVGQWESVILGDETDFAFEPHPGLGIAVDLGTTTLVAQLVDFASGRVLGVASAVNPQVEYGADVMSRIGAAVSGGGRDRLVELLRSAVGRLVVELVVEAASDDAAAAEDRSVSRVVIAGNTAMQHFFCGLDPRPLSAWPFDAKAGEAMHLRAGDLGWPSDADLPVTFLPSLGGFVGSDILCGVLAIGMHRRETPCVLVDLGTNGEIVVGNRDRMLCASTAAGPAFEGGGIDNGMRATTGAVHQVRAEQGRLHASVLGGGAARGICGSGLVDAVAVALELGLLEPSGRIAGKARSLAVTPTVLLTQQDIRQLQLAKAAIAAGIRSLRGHFGEAADASSVPVFLAGAFGNYVDPAAASRIGLLDVEAARIRPAGNTALLGAKIALLGGDTDGYDFESLLARVEHIALADDPAFADLYVREMPFPKAVR